MEAGADRSFLSIVSPSDDEYNRTNQYKLEIFSKNQRARLVQETKKGGQTD